MASQLLPSIMRPTAELNRLVHGTSRMIVPREPPATTFCRCTAPTTTRRLRSTVRHTSLASWNIDSAEQRPTWNEEWKALGLGAKLINKPLFPQHLFFVQLGFGVDQHGDNSDATKAAMRAVRNAIEFNSIPGVIDNIPGGRSGMLIHVKLGIPKGASVDLLQVAKVFPYGKLLPIQTTVGGLEFATGRVVEELGDSDDTGICVAACISIGYGDADESSDGSHVTYNTKDGH